jgi:hypothetical protein
MYFVAAFIGMAALGDDITATRVAGLPLAGVGVALVAR